MKKILTLLIAMIMIFSIPTTAHAATAKITVSGATAKRGQMVYLDVTLSDCKKANTLGISMEYDSSVLKKVASDCSWENKGTIEDFSVSKDNGVWGIKKAKDINGKICTLAFRIKANAAIEDTEVTCKVVVKNDSKTIGTYTAKATVSVTCEHSYGEWEQKDDTVHKKVCKYCEYEKTVEHNWVKSSENEELTVYTCEQCGMSKEAKSTGSGEETPNKPDTIIIKPNHSNQENSDSNHGNESIVQPSDSSQKNENVTKPEGSSQDDDRTDVSEQQGSQNSIQSGDLNSKNENVTESEGSGQEDDDKYVSELVDDKEHQHTDECNHAQEEKDTDVYLWIIIIAIVLGASVYGFIKFKTKKK